MTVETKPLIEFDHHSPEFARNWREILGGLSARTPIAWTEAHGGFWVLSDHDAIRAATKDWETFSSRNEPDGGPGAPRGIVIPPLPVPVTLNESDPPDSTRRRMLEAPFFTPRALAHHASAVHRMVDEALDSIIAKGGGELVQDLVMRVPAKTVLHVVGVPEEQWADFAIPAHAASRVPDDSPDLPREELSAISDRLVRLIRQRRAAPKEDMATAMAHARIDGEPLPDEVGAGLLYTLAIGGFDTATSLLCNALIWLGDHREAWPMLLESHESLENGINELLRVFPPNVGTLRNVTRDVEVCGQMLRKGERVMMSWGGGNYDPRKFESPFEIRLDRKNAADHLSFGWGGHRCLGAPLARLEARTILGGVLRRIPNYRILKDEVSRFETIGKVIGFNEVPFVLD